jgi:hypothetical protein
MFRVRGHLKPQCYIMAKLASVHLSKVQTGGLARVSKVGTVAEAVTAVTNRIKAATLVTVQQVLDRTAVAGVVLSGLAQANVLTGADGSGKPHVSVRSNFFLATQTECDAFVASLSTLQTVEAVQAAYYEFIDNHSINGVVWQGEPAWEQRSNQGTFTGFLRADAVTGDVSISGITAEKPTAVLQAKKLPSLSASIPVAPASGMPAPPQAGAPTPPPAPQPTMKLVNGTAYSPSDLLAGGWSQAAIDELPNA